MWLYFDRSGRYVGRSQRLTGCELGCLPFIVVLVMVMAVTPVIWPLAVWGTSWLGSILTIAWNLLWMALFVLVLGRPSRRHRKPETPVAPPADSWHDDGRRLA